MIIKNSGHWCSLIVLVRKKDGTIRCCVDYRKLNDVTNKDAYPLPRIEDILDALRESLLFLIVKMLLSIYKSQVDKYNCIFLPIVAGTIFSVHLYNPMLIYRVLERKKTYTIYLYFIVKSCFDSLNTNTAIVLCRFRNPL